MAADKEAAVGMGGLREVLMEVGGAAPGGEVQAARAAARAVVGNMAGQLEATVGA